MQNRITLEATGATVPGWSYTIITKLRIHKKLCNRDLAALVGKAEPRVSEVARKLAEAGIISRTKRGKEVVYS